MTGLTWIYTYKQLPLCRLHTQGEKHIALKTLCWEQMVSETEAMTEFYDSKLPIYII